MLCAYACVDQKSALAVPFGTEKAVGFPSLNAIFDTAASQVGRSDVGAYPYIFAGLAVC
jgi:hypothetical protein